MTITSQVHGSFVCVHCWQRSIHRWFFDTASSCCTVSCLNMSSEAQESDHGLICIYNWRRHIGAETSYLTELVFHMVYAQNPFPYSELSHSHSQRQYTHTFICCNSSLCRQNLPVCSRVITVIVNACVVYSIYTVPCRYHDQCDGIMSNMYNGSMIPYDVMMLHILVCAVWCIIPILVLSLCLPCWGLQQW